MMPSTPQSSSRCMSAASFTVHTCTATPASWAYCTKRGETTRVAPDCSGTWNASFGGCRTGQRIHDRYRASRVSSREAPVRIARLVGARGAEDARAERSDRDAIERARGADLVDRLVRQDRIVDLELDDEERGRVAPQHVFQRRHAAGGAAETDRSGSPRPAARARPRCAPPAGPWPFVVRSRVVSWCTTTTPSRDRWTSNSSPSAPSDIPMVEGENRVLRPQGRPPAMREHLGPAKRQCGVWTRHGVILSPSAPLLISIQ